MSTGLDRSFSVREEVGAGLLSGAAVCSTPSARPLAAVQLAMKLVPCACAVVDAGSKRVLLHNDSFERQFIGSQTDVPFSEIFRLIDKSAFCPVSPEGGADFFGSDEGASFCSFARA